MTEFANPETYNPGDMGEVDHEQLVLRQIQVCRNALNKPAVTGYMGSAQLDNANHPQVSTTVMAKKWLHGTNYKAASCVESLHDLTKPLHDEEYTEADEDLKERAVEKLAALFDDLSDYVEDGDYSYRDVFRKNWQRRVRPLVRERFNNLLMLCARQSIIGGVQGVEDES